MNKIIPIEIIMLLIVVLLGIIFKIRQEIVFKIFYRRLKESDTIPNYGMMLLQMSKWTYKSFFGEE